MQRFVRDLLAFGPKHPIRDKFKELHLSAAIENLIRNLRENNVTAEKLFEIEMYSKNIREIPLERSLAKVQKYLRYSALIAVSFDKGVRFCAMKKSTYAEKLEGVIDCKQFRKHKKSCDIIVKKDEKELNDELLDTMKKMKIPVKVYEDLRSTGAQPARW